MPDAGGSPVTDERSEVLSGRLRALRSRSEASDEALATAANLPVNVVTGLLTGHLGWGEVALFPVVDLLEDTLGLDDAGDFFEGLPVPRQPSPGRSAQ